MSAASTPDADPPVPGGGLPANLLAFFTQALESYERSPATLRVLCSLPSAPSSPDELAPSPPASRPRFLLVLDSSFNPPTLAHLRMALSAASDPRFAEDSRVLLLLATSNADKAPKPAAFPQRLAMMYIFARDLRSAMRRPRDGGDRETPAAAVPAAIDIAVTTEPYFHSKSRAVAECDFYCRCSEASKTESGAGSEEALLEQVYLTGFDTLIRIFNPKYYLGGNDNPMAAALDPFFARARLRVTMRTDADWGDAEAQRAYAEGLRRGGGSGPRAEWAEKVELVEGRREGEAIVSSTKVRDAVVGRDWDLLRALVSERMIGWIRKEGLYAWEDR